MSDPQISYGVLSNIISHSNEQGWFAPRGVVLQILKYKRDDKNIRFLLHDGKNSAPGFCTEAPEGLDLSDIENVPNSLIRIQNYSIRPLKGKYYVLIRSAEYIGKGEFPSEAPTALPVASNSTEIFSFVNDQNKSTKKEDHTVSTDNRYSAPHQKKTSNELFTEISALTPFTTKWRICARVEYRSDIRTFKSKTSGNDGSLFNVTFVDKSGEIRATGFNEIVEKYYNMLEPGSVFVIAGARINTANKRYSNLKHDYEITLDRNTTIEPADGFSESVPKMIADFTPLDKLPDIESESVINVIGVAHNVYDATSQMSKSGREYTKRDIILVDKSLFMVRVTLWSETATKFDDSKQGHVVAIKGARVSDFNGKSLSVLASGLVINDPEIDEAYNLQGWYQNGGHDSNFKWISTSSGDGTFETTEKYLTLQEVTENRLGMSDTPDFFVTMAVVNRILQREPYYPACTQTNCNKKVTQQTNEKWRCEKCDMEIEKPNYRYVLSVPANDYTDQIWVSCFDETAQVFLGVSANELYEYHHSDEEAYKHVMEDYNHNEYIFRIKARKDFFNNVERVRYQVVNIHQADFVTESRKLLDNIQEY